MDIQLHYREKGSGEPLLLLHGNGEDGTYFARQIEFFAPHYRVVAVDTRGHGQSPRGSAPFTIRQFADDLLGFMDGLGIEKAHILGFSDGGNIALIFAMRYPARVGRLVLNGANLSPSGVKPSAQIPITIGYRIASLFAGVSGQAKRNAELLALMVDGPNIRPEELGQVKAKTLVVAGTKDLIKEGHTRAICAALPDAGLVLIPGSHFVAKENPDAFNAAVEAFLRD